MKSTNFRDSMLYGLVIYQCVGGIFVSVFRAEEEAKD